MHRGTMFVIVNDNEVWKSTEFNGGMGLDCYGKEVVKVFQKVSTLQQFKDMVLAFDVTHHNYQDKVMFYKADEQKSSYTDDKGNKWFDYYKKGNQYNFFRDSKKGYIYTSDSNYIKNLSNKDVKVVCENGIYILKPNQLLICDYEECINNTRKSFGKQIDKDIPIDTLDVYKENELNKDMTDNQENIDYDY